MILSKRLLQVLKYAKNHQCLADVGSDHAHLVIAFGIDQQNKGYAIENKKGPFDKAVTNINQSGVSHLITCLLQDGLTYCPSDVDAVSICGMGGKMMVDILNHHDRNHPITNCHLILQPNSQIEVVREWLSHNRFMIIDEAIIEERKKMYEIIYAKYDSNTNPLSQLDVIFGPVLRRNQSEVFIKKYSRLKALKLASLSKINPSATKEINDIKREIRLIEEVLNEN